tara:strand:+ start:171 stop:338 length:168 start_codon:yes stop_codon:yes gene_type:complete
VRISVYFCCVIDFFFCDSPTSLQDFYDFYGKISLGMGKKITDPFLLTDFSSSEYY